MGVSLYPASVLEGDLSPEMGPEIEEICQEIHEACKGWGTNEARLLKAMGKMTPETRCKVPIKYKELFGKSLRATMESECGNRDFGTALQFLAVPPDEADCDIIDVACKGSGTKKMVLSSVLCGRTNEEMEILKKTYFRLHTKDLGRVLDKELGGDYEDFIFNILQADEQTFDPDFHTPEKVQEDVAAFYKMGQGRWGTNEKGLFKLICALPAEHLDTVNKAYAEKHGYTLYKVMEKELGGGDLGKATLFCLGMKLKPEHAVATLIHDAVKGFGTNELLLTTALIRYQPILNAVKQAYMEEYGKVLEDVIKKETSGDYEKLLLEVVATADVL